jgi:Protein of unknown function (DUF2845)
MSTRNPWFAALALAGVLLAMPAQAMRCGSRLVTEGDHISKVLRYCGDPLGVQQRLVVRSGLTRPRYRIGNSSGVIYEREILASERSYEEVQIEEWTYNFGPRRFMRLVVFENGFVADIKPLGYGFQR